MCPLLTHEVGVRDADFNRSWWKRNGSGRKMSPKSIAYAAIEDDIAAWVRGHSLTLFTRWGEREIRCCYATNPRGECLQIWVEPPENGYVTVNLASVETADDKEVHNRWTVPIPDLRKTLELAYGTLVNG
jgi:hypothetical protein